MNWDRFDIMEAHYAFDVDYGRGFVTSRLKKMGFTASVFVREHGRDGLRENGKSIYDRLRGNLK